MNEEQLVDGTDEAGRPVKKRRALTLWISTDGDTFHWERHGNCPKFTLATAVYQLFVAVSHLIGVRTIRSSDLRTYKELTEPEKRDSTSSHTMGSNDGPSV